MVCFQINRLLHTHTHTKKTGLEVVNSKADLTSYFQERLLFFRNFPSASKLFPRASTFLLQFSITQRVISMSVYFSFTIFHHIESYFQESLLFFHNFPHLASYFQERLLFFCNFPSASELFPRASTLLTQILQTVYTHLFQQPLLHPATPVTSEVQTARLSSTRAHCL